MQKHRIPGEKKIYREKGVQFSQCWRKKGKERKGGEKGEFGEFPIFLFIFP